MKILITEQQLQTINEISDRIKEQIEVIYQDKNIICFIPKTQEASKIYGRGANWCQRHNQGFELWSKRGLLIRFLFRGGRKIRTTYFFKGNDVEGKYYWANENGFHVLFGDTNNPFDAVHKEGRIRITEQDIIDHINLIPDECKKAVLEFIQKNEEGFDYCYKNDEYETKKEIIFRNNIKSIQEKYSKYINYIYDSKQGNFFGIFINNDWEYTLSYGVDDMFETLNTKDFKEFNSLVFNKLKEILTYLNEKKGQN